MEVEIFEKPSRWAAGWDLFIKFSLCGRKSHWRVPPFVPDNPQAWRVSEGYWEERRSGVETVDLDLAVSVWEPAFEIDVRQRLASVLEEMKEHPGEISRELETEMRKRGWMP
jgi:hypothetical protein